MPKSLYLMCLPPATKRQFSRMTETEDSLSHFQKIYYSVFFSNFISFYFHIMEGSFKFKTKEPQKNK